MPFIFQPQIATPSLGTSGFGDLNPTFFFAPAKAGKIIWGAGPTFSLRTESSSALGNGKWGAGPSIVVLTQPKHWTVGFLANNIWSFAGDQNRRDVNAFLLQYFVNYNLKEGWYLTSQPIVTADWKAAFRKTVGGAFRRRIRPSFSGSEISPSMGRSLLITTRFARTTSPILAGPYGSRSRCSFRRPSRHDTDAFHLAGRQLTLWWPDFGEKQCSRVLSSW